MSQAAVSDQELVAEALSLPSTYSKVRLGMTLHPTHERVLDTLFARDRSRVVFRAANGTGKTSRCATTAILHALEIHNAMAISTASVWRQVTKQLIPNLKLHSHLFPNWEFTDTGIKDSQGPRYIGFSADNEATAQGFHSDVERDRPLLAIIDEAAGVSDGIFNAIEERVMPTWLLVVGSPLGPEGRFYEMETKLAAFYDHFKLAQDECPWIDPDEVQRKIAKWGRDHPLVLSSVFAQFAMNIEGALLSLTELENCLRNPPEFKGHRRHVFCDFAAGGAENVVAVCYGNRAWIEEAWVDTDTMRAAGKFVNIFKELQKRIGLQVKEIDGDADGLGKPIIDRLHELDWKIGRFHGGGDPKYDTEYKNLISEVWGTGCRKIARCEVILVDGDDQELKAQLLNRKTRMNSSGQLEIEGKKELAARNVVSPDRADALLGAIHPGVGQFPKVWTLPAAPEPQSSF